MNKDPKQILPYLPYNVKYYRKSHSDPRCAYVKTLSLDDPDAIKLLLIHSDFFLVLRPMSDLVLSTSNPLCKLFECHFDIFGLIGKGDAIDINTLKSSDE